MVTIRQKIKARRTQPPKWHLLYFLLAAFDLAAITFSLTVTHRIAKGIVHTVSVNQEWVDRLQGYGKLRHLIGEIDAPGNDVFITHDVAGESRKMLNAYARFQALVPHLQQDLNSLANSDRRKALTESLNDVIEDTAAMVEQGQKTFASLDINRPDLAGAEMATMDHRYAAALASISELGTKVNQIQRINFDDDLKQVAALRKYERVFSLLILLMIGSVTLYGTRLAKSLDAAAKEREEQGKALRQSEARLRDILEHAADGIVVTDVAGEILSANFAASQLLGRDPEALIGQTFAAAIKPCLLPKTWSTGESHEVTITRPDASAMPVELRCSRIERPDGQLTTVFLRDLSERRKSERLRVEKETAEAASRMKSEFIANISHEIRTPMTAILGFLDLLLTAHGEDRTRFAGVVRKNGEHLLGIVNDLLDLSKAEAGKMTIENVCFSVRELVDEVTELMRARAEEKGLAVELKIDRSVPLTVETDPTRLRQILLNLLGNAVKFTHEGSVVLEVRAEALPRGEGGLDANREAVRLYFSVSDTGIGIPPEKRVQIFQPFSQVDPSTSRNYGGTGLGLAVSKRLIEMLGGSIVVDSTLGRGSTFRFDAVALLPLA